MPREMNREIESRNEIQTNRQDKQTNKETKQETEPERRNQSEKNTHTRTREKKTYSLLVDFLHKTTKSKAKSKAIQPAPNIGQTINAFNMELGGVAVECQRNAREI